MVPTWYILRFFSGLRIFLVTWRKISPLKSFWQIKVTIISLLLYLGVFPDFVLMSVSWGGAIMRWRPLWGINIRGLQRRQIFHNSFICREPLQSVGNHREDCKGKSGSFCLAANNTQTQKHVDEMRIADHSIRWRLARNIEGNNV